MARIAGVDLPRDKRVEIGLTYIYGIGRTSASRILADAGVDPNTRVRDLTSEEVKKISAVINETQVVEGDLRREIQLNIKRLKERHLLRTGTLFTAMSILLIYTYERFHTAFQVTFRCMIMFSRRLHSSAFRRAASVMRNRCYVFDTYYVNTACLKSTDCRFTS